MSKKVRIGLVYGGRSGEHDVSLQTALSVIKAFDLSKYEIVPFYITRQGEWRSGPQLSGPIEKKEMLTFDEKIGEQEANALLPLFNSITNKLETMTNEPQNEGKHAIQNDQKLQNRERQVDVIFPLLHGTFGEDGTIQGLLEMANIPYVGAGVLASAVGMDKVTMKKIFAQEGLPQCVFRHFTRYNWEKDRSFYIMEIEVSLGYPCFVKPVNLGSSVGISKAVNREELIEAVDLALRYDRKVIVEENVDAREIEVSVLGNDAPKASVPGEIVSSNDFYDYKAKYVDGKSVMVIPAQIPAETAERLQEMALRAFQAIDGSGLARVDFFMRKSDGEIMINEINTMPGFTPISMYPLLWRESGLSYRELLDELISLAIHKHQLKQRIDYGFGVE